MKVIACVLAEEAHKRLYNPQRMSVNGSLPIKVYNNILSEKGVLSSEVMESSLIPILTVERAGYEAIVL